MKAFDFSQVGKDIQRNPEFSPPPDNENGLINIDAIKDALANKDFDAAKEFEAAILDFTIDIPPPPVVLKIGDSGICTLGNFSLVIGKAKSRKSFFMAMLTIAALQNRIVFDKLEGSLPDDKRHVLYFDTEQSKYHVLKAMKRICRAMGTNDPANITTVCLRAYSAKERVEIVEHAILNTPNLGFVVIDGIKDLLTSINDEEQANLLTTKLMQWTEKQYIHIVCVLHQNKGNTDARGHIGTEMINKAESVLSVTKDKANKDISIVEPEFCRDIDPESFAFEIDAEGMPQPVEHWQLKSEKYDTQKGITPLQIPLPTHFDILLAVFSKSSQLKGTEFISSLKLEMERLGHKKIGDSKARDFRTYYLKEGMIERHGKDTNPHSFYTLSEPD